MGMFDDLRFITVPKCLVDARERETDCHLNLSNWQTKEFDNNLDTYFVFNDELFKMNYDINRAEKLAFTGMVDLIAYDRMPNGDSYFYNVDVTFQDGILQSCSNFLVNFSGTTMPKIEDGIVIYTSI